MVATYQHLPIRTKGRTGEKELWNRHHRSLIDRQ
jgi:hypothetical protein